jgi:hypothetical protein
MKNKLIIGSRAAKHHFPEFPRDPNDLDIMCESTMMTKDIQHYWFDDASIEILKKNIDDQFIDPNLLLTLKVSHAGWDIHWSKTIHDILFLKRMGCVVDKDLYKSLVKFFTIKHGKKWVSLKGKNTDTFFVDAVERKYVHDDIHDAVAVYDKPLYDKLIFEGVSCSKKGFEKLSFEDKILLVKEEVWVTALERYLIPSNFTCGHRAAYEKSLKKLATTMSSGWFKFFILENIDKLVGCDKKEYIDKFKQNEKQNKLRKYEK